MEVVMKVDPDTGTFLIPKELHNTLALLLLWAEKAFARVQMKDESAIRLVSIVAEVVFIFYVSPEAPDGVSLFRCPCSDAEFTLTYSATSRESSPTLGDSATLPLPGNNAGTARRRTIYFLALWSCNGHGRSTEARDGALEWSIWQWLCCVRLKDLLFFGSALGWAAATRNALAGFRRVGFLARHDGVGMRPRPHGLLFGDHRLVSERMRACESASSLHALLIFYAVSSLAQSAARRWFESNGRSFFCVLKNTGLVAACNFFPRAALGKPSGAACKKKKVSNMAASFSCFFQPRKKSRCFLFFFWGEGGVDWLFFWSRRGFSGGGEGGARSRCFPLPFPIVFPKKKGRGEGACGCLCGFLNPREGFASREWHSPFLGI
eukprot:gene10896-7554_t